MIFLAILLAISSPLSSAKDYHFLRPPTNSIHGLIIGENGDCGVMRFEDIAFLTEAINERSLCVKPQTLTRFTDALGRMTNNLALPVIRNMAFNLPLSDYLAPENTLSEFPQEISNIVFVATNYLWQTGYEPYCRTNLIYQTMRDGSLNVYTNIWNRFFSNHWERVVTTNYHGSSAEWCLEDGILKPWIISNRCINGSEWKLKEFYTKADITNLYSVVGSLQRTYPRAVDPYLTTTNLNAQVKREILRDSGSVSTNYLVSSVTWMIQHEAEDAYYNSQYRDTEGSWESVDGYPTNTFYRMSFEGVPTRLRYLLKTGIPSIADTYGMAGNHRITKIDIFAEVNFSYYSVSSADASGKESIVNSTNIQTAVILPIPGNFVVRDTEDQDTISYVIDIDSPYDYVFLPAYNETLLPLVQYETMPDLPDPLSPEWDNDDHATLRHQYHIEQIEESISAAITRFYYILTPNFKTNWR